jgi:hypothetical protein
VIVDDRRLIDFDVDDAIQLGIPQPNRSSVSSSCSLTVVSQFFVLFSRHFQVTHSSRPTSWTGWHQSMKGCCDLYIYHGFAYASLRAVQNSLPSPLVSSITPPRAVHFDLRGHPRTTPRAFPGCLGEDMEDTAVWTNLWQRARCFQ